MTDIHPHEVLLGQQPWPSVAAQILQWADATPNAVAITQQDSGYTYQHLANAMAVIMHTLDSAEVRAGQTVAVIGPRGFTLVAAWTAILAHRVVLLPVDALMPAERQQRVLAYADHIVVIDEVDVPPMQVPILRVPALVGDLPRRELAVPPPPTADEPGYVFMTSGTTGQPKAIIGRHRSLAHFLHWQRTTFAIGPRDRVAQMASVEFDVSLREVFLPLTSGATLCLPPAGPLSAGSALTWLADERVTVLGAVPTVARAWLRAAPGPLRLPALRAVFFSGEALLASVVDRWRQQLDYHAVIINLYGPTETTFVRSWHLVPDPSEPGIQPLGRPLPGSTLWVETDDRQIGGPLTVGEIVIRTPYASGGYLNATAEENARFSVDPAHPHDTVYHTGDLGYLDANGVLHFHSRIDDQVKIYGTRIHLRGVEAVLEQQAGIDQAVVIVDPGLRCDGAPARLSAYLILSTGRTAVPEGLRAALRRHLPATAIPSRFFVADGLPTTAASGKVDRRRLASTPFHRPDQENLR
jgi:amino acid adenylation domain-containing protein